MEDTIFSQRVQCEMEFLVQMGAQCKVKLQEYVDRARDKRLRRITSDVVQ